MTTTAYHPSYLDFLPPICGDDAALAAALAGDQPVALPNSDVDFATLQAGFANALHMHQPLIPAGGDDLETAAIVSNLQQMLAEPGSGDAYNAGVFLECYRRMATFIEELVAEGVRPRILLDYSGTLLYGLQQMGRDDILTALKRLTTDPATARCVEWLGSPWGHAVAPSTPVQDYRLHVRAWQHHFAALFGLEALRRVRGFSPAEMALPNHPDVAYEFVRTLRDCGYRWVLVQEHTIEPVAGGGFDPHLPCRLVAKNSRGQSAWIVAVIKTQGSDTKLVAQMQPYYEAQGQGRRVLAGREVPALVTQIADGENGGVMMNEFPSKYLEVMREASGRSVAPVNVTETLEALWAQGVRPEDLPAVQPVLQHRLWADFPEGAGPEALAEHIATLQAEDDRFHMEGGSWTNDLSWVRGYESVLGPMQAVSARFAEKVLAPKRPLTDPPVHEALTLLLLTQTSCFRYWGQGLWTDYGRELCRRLEAVLNKL